ncbi:MAG: hypothetical protein L0H83_01600 [Salinisphaera sp.]|nr:hypothetical protein [Salinisphaera sp.]
MANQTINIGRFPSRPALGDRRGAGQGLIGAWGYRNKVYPLSIVFTLWPVSSLIAKPVLDVSVLTAPAA